MTDGISVLFEAQSRGGKWRVYVQSKPSAYLSSGQSYTIVWIKSGREMGRQNRASYPEAMAEVRRRIWDAARFDGIDYVEIGGAR